MSGKVCMRLLAAVGTVGFLAAAGPARAAEPYAAAAPVQRVYVQPVVVSDDAITQGIQQRLADDKLLRHAQVTVSSVSGVVTLVGTVPSTFARDNVLEAARATPGVVRIDDQLRLNISSPEAPTWN
jgi:hypothetical protein